MAQVGRPSKYTPGLLEKAKAYLDDYEHYGAQFPSHIGLSLYLGIDPTTLYAWRDEEGKEEFSHILKTILMIQQEMLVGHGLDGSFKPTICKLALGKHGYKDQGALTGANDKPLIPEYSDTEIARRALSAMTKLLKDAKDG